MEVILICMAYLIKKLYREIYYQTYSSIMANRKKKKNKVREKEISQVFH